eukprot:m.67810 g.67810  ORF g.67810 m.67810 type:complete len:184 (+) comp13854_c1_seq1:217-768(+)
MSDDEEPVAPDVAASELSYVPEFDPDHTDSRVVLLATNTETPDLLQECRSCRPGQNGPWPQIVMLKPLFGQRYEFRLDWTTGGGCFNVGMLPPTWNPENKKNLAEWEPYWNTKGLTSDSYTVVIDYDAHKWSIKSNSTAKSHYDHVIEGFPEGFVMGFQVFNCCLRITAAEPEIPTKGAGKLT